LEYYIEYYLKKKKLDGDPFLLSPSPLRTIRHCVDDVKSRRVKEINYYQRRYSNVLRRSKGIAVFVGGKTIYFGAPRGSFCARELVRVEKYWSKDVHCNGDGWCCSSGFIVLYFRLGNKMCLIKRVF